MSLFYVLDENDKPVPVKDEVEWGAWMAEKTRETGEDARFVARSNVGDAHVPTVFLGVNHRHFGDGPPILFETMVFGGSEDGYQERYATWEGALAGHERVVDKLAASRSQDGTESALR